MKELDTIIEEQALLLKWNGYDEKTLKNGEREDSYKEYLRIAVNTLLDKNIVLLDKEPFQIHLFGYFNEQKDKVLFTFSYEFDPFLSQISLKEVEARLDNVPIVLPIEQGSDLWTSQQMYERVKSLSNPINDAIGEEKTVLLNAIIGKESASLYEQKYAGNFIQHFTYEISRAESKPQEEYHFAIKGKMKMGNDYPDILHYRLHYIYHRKHAALQLKSIYARVDDTSKILKGTRDYPIPPAPDIYEFLLQEHRAAKSKMIIQQQPNSDKSNKPSF